MLLFALAQAILCFTKDGIVYDSENMVHITGVTTDFQGFLTPEASVKTISDGAFRDYQGITGIQLGENIESIGRDAFIGSSIENVTIIGVTALTISKGAFARCSSLSHLTISGTAAISAGAFDRCKLLERVCLSGSVTVETGAFESRAKFTCEPEKTVDPGLEKGMKAFSIILIIMTIGAFILGLVLQMTVPNKHDPERIWKDVGAMDAVPKMSGVSNGRSRNPLQEPLNYSVPV